MSCQPYRYGLPALMAALLLCAAVQAQPRYEQDWPSIDYATAPLKDPISQLFGDRDLSDLPHHPERGYLDAVLTALDIDPRSQVLVFSKSSKKRGLIAPETPRALYFNDNSYVGFVPRGSSLEVAAMDPELGPVFFEISQSAAEGPVTLQRETTSCLRCHDSYSMSGGGTPRFMLSSALTGPDGRIVSHEVNFVTDSTFPIYQRWGGVYVTGGHGEQRHLGNLMIESGSDLARRDEGSNGNIMSLEGFFETDDYLRDTSDIVALLVLEHQIQLQNRITRSHYQVKDAMDRDGMNEQTREIIAEAGDALVADLLMSEEAPLGDKVTSSSGFTEHFESQGPFDAEGRSLRELDLTTRTFQYPLSYLVYSDAFLALPGELKDYIYARLYRVLSAEEALEGMRHNRREMATALSILKDTHEEFAAASQKIEQDS